MGSGSTESSELAALLSGSHPADFWRFAPDPPAEQWEEALAAAVEAEPEWAAIYRDHGWAGLAEHLLGEGQFGPDRYRLSLPKRIYYEVKPALPRGLRQLAKHGYRHRQEATSRLSWPADDRLARLLHTVRDDMSSRFPESKPTPLWPEGARFALVLTHDIEEARGQEHVRALADVEESLGFRSSFNFVPERYAVDEGLITELRERGFEVGVHGLRHDGKLFRSRRTFERRARRINEYLLRWGAAGFRAPLTHRDPVLMQRLDMEYDSSFFDTDPYEPMAGGTLMIWPFRMGRFIELPYTLVQDHTLLMTLGARSPRIWLDKIDMIKRWSGMALLNTHPDYLIEDSSLDIYRSFLVEVAERGGYWHGLPQVVARWWRRRSGS